MPTTIVTKNSSTASAVPSSGSLTQGELAVNVTDKKLYTKDSGGTVVELTGLKSADIGVSVQAYDADLGAVAGLSSNGIIARTGAGTASVRTITGTTDVITVTNGDGVSGNPTLTTGSLVARTDTAQSFTALQTFAGSSSVAATKLTNIKEVVTVSATAATGTIAYDVTTQSVLYYTTDASGNFTVNFRGSSGTSLNTIMATGESMSVTFLVTNGSTAYYNSAVQVDGNSVTPKWQGGTAPTSGNASSIDAYTYVIFKTGSATFTVLASVTKFA